MYTDCALMVRNKTWAVYASEKTSYHNLSLHMNLSTYQVSNFAFAGKPNLIYCTGCICPAFILTGRILYFTTYHESYLSFKRASGLSPQKGKSFVPQKGKLFVPQ